MNVFNMNMSMSHTIHGHISPRELQMKGARSGWVTRVKIFVSKDLYGSGSGDVENFTRLEREFGGCGGFRADRRLFNYLLTHNFLSKTGIYWILLTTDRQTYTHTDIQIG